MPLAEELSSYALSLSYGDLSAHAVHTAKQRLVDSLGCGLGAFDATPVRNGRAFAEAYLSPACTVLGTRQTTTPDIAAFVNGTMVRYFDFNDGYIGKEVGHPSDNVPACLAVAEAEGSSDADLLLAIVLAYEIQCGFQDAANLHRGGWDHVNYVLLASTIAAGRLMRLSQRQLTDAINIALNSHIAMRQVRSGALSQWKGSSAPNAARNGIVSARLAQHGFTGPSPVFEGQSGFKNQVVRRQAAVRDRGRPHRPPRRARPAGHRPERYGQRRTRAARRPRSRPGGEQPRRAHPRAPRQLARSRHRRAPRHGPHTAHDHFAVLPAVRRFLAACLAR
ncbi:MmgE/PrpD family protein [Streptomyces ferrugineus]|uniref:MmgE/PrpD family protein n=1 Tax=Streptomyces ferrugineus TaxID=1413221 RepID=A0A7M2SY83_9ACTN|nr:MmgE/PrpD family protein [Streptomyces ferrugineus]QOV40879.1 MmgE/PrpD family protein [Streptomyces ferrugineus]